MGTVSLRETNEDMITRIAGQDLRANLVLRAMLSVAAESTDEVAARAEAARIAAKEAGEPVMPQRTPYYEYMMLVALRQAGVSGAQLVALHDKVGAANPTLTAALAIEAFSSRSNRLSEICRRVDSGLPVTAGLAMMALQNIRATYGHFNSATYPTEIVPMRPTQAMPHADDGRSMVGPVGTWQSAAQPRAGEIAAPATRKKQPQGNELAAL